MVNRSRLSVETADVGAGSLLLAAQRATDAELNRINMLKDAIRDKIAETEDRLEDEKAFHMTIAAAAHNSFLNNILQTIFQAFDKNDHIFSYPVIDAGTLLDHQMICDYLNARNADAARAAMRVHMMRGIRLLESVHEEYNAERDVNEIIRWMMRLL